MNPPMGDTPPVAIDAEAGAVRQDSITKSVAVRRDVAGDNPERWAVMTAAGGHYGTDAEVADWTPLVPEGE